MPEAAATATDTDEPVSPLHDYLTEALSKAQGVFLKVQRTKEADIRGKEGKAGYKFRYAPLSAVMDAVQPALTQHALALSHRLGGGCLYSRLSHASGQWLESEFPLPQGNVPMQAMGSALTYAQRYNVRLLLNLSDGDDDDDGNEADGNSATVRPVMGWRGTLSQAAREIESGEANGTPQPPRQPGRAAATPPGAADYVTRFIAAIAGQPDRETLKALWDSKAEQRDRLETDHPAEHERLLTAYDEKLEQFRVPRI